MPRCCARWPPAPGIPAWSPGRWGRDSRIRKRTGHALARIRAVQCVFAYQDSSCTGPSNARRLQPLRPGARHHRASCSNREFPGNCATRLRARSDWPAASHIACPARDGCPNPGWLANRKSGGFRCCRRIAPCKDGCVAAEFEIPFPFRIPGGRLPDDRDSRRSRT